VKTFVIRVPESTGRAEYLIGLEGERSTFAASAYPRRVDAEYALYQVRQLGTLWPEFRQRLERAEVIPLAQANAERELWNQAPLLAPLGEQT
jgi:hypothetical protein